MGRNKNNTIPEAARMASWAGSQFSLMSPTSVETQPNKKILGFGSSSNKALNMVESGLDVIEHDDLKQGSLYIVKIRNVSVALFEGWDDDMCCFAVLRSESTPMRWSEARYIPGDFDAFDAFDEAGNPPVHLWTRHLRVNVPVNWFSIFEEARRKQRNWMNEQNEDDEYRCYPVEQDETPAGRKRRNKKSLQEAAINSPPETDKSSSNSSPTGSQISGNEDNGAADDGDSVDREHDDAASTSSQHQQQQHPGTSHHRSVDKSPDAAANHDEPASGDGSPVLRATGGSSLVPPAQAALTSNTSPGHPGTNEQHVAATRSHHRQQHPTPRPAAAAAAPAAAEPRHVKPSSPVDINKTEASMQDMSISQSSKYPNTPPTLPRATSTSALPPNAVPRQQVPYQPQFDRSSSNNLFGATDFAFPHNETQFSIQGSGFSDSMLSSSSASLQGRLANGATTGSSVAQHQRDDTATSAKSKRRSVQGLFRK